MKKLVQEKPQRRKTSVDNFLGHAPVILCEMRMLAFFLNTVKWFRHGTCFSGPRSRSLLQRNSKEGMREKKVPRTYFQVWAGYPALWDPNAPQRGQECLWNSHCVSSVLPECFYSSCITPVGAKCLPWRRKWQPTPIFLLGNPADKGARRATVPWTLKESDKA